jgi:hypothetical protein
MASKGTKCLHLATSDQCSSQSRRPRTDVEGEDVELDTVAGIRARRGCGSRGLPPDTVLEARHEGGDITVMPATIGEAAK